MTSAKKRARMYRRHGPGHAAVRGRHATHTGDEGLDRGRKRGNGVQPYTHSPVPYGSTCALSLPLPSWGMKWTKHGAGTTPGPRHRAPSRRDTLGSGAYLVLLIPLRGGHVRVKAPLVVRTAAALRVAQEDVVIGFAIFTPARRAALREVGGRQGCGWPWVMGKGLGTVEAERRGRAPPGGGCVQWGSGSQGCTAPPVPSS